MKRVKLYNVDNNLYLLQVNPTRQSQQIQQHLGNFQLLQHLLDDQPVKQLIGIAGLNPPASPAPAEFKKPPQARPASSNAPPPGSVRSGFVKPQDGKPPYGQFWVLFFI